MLLLYPGRRDPMTAPTSYLPMLSTVLVEFLASGLQQSQASEISTHTYVHQKQQTQ